MIVTDSFYLTIFIFLSSRSVLGKDQWVKYFSLAEVKPAFMSQSFSIEIESSLDGWVMNHRSTEAQCFMDESSNLSDYQRKPRMKVPKIAQEI